MANVVEERDLERLAERIVRFRLSVLAVFLLELGKPLAFLGSQMLLLWSPLVHLFVDPDRYDRFAQHVASRDAWEALIRRIEDESRAH